MHLFSVFSTLPLIFLIGVEFLLVLWINDKNIESLIIYIATKQKIQLKKATLLTAWAESKETTRCQVTAS